ncbi:MAG: ribonuclease T [Succinivibrionaceae bacterium]|nr:ribonuclease T [Succinivibrionaceae bacterium]
MSSRFRGYLPVVIDVETAGFSPRENALLEIGAYPLIFDADGLLRPGELLHYKIRPFEGAKINEKSCQFIHIDPFDPTREAEDERTAIRDLCKKVSARVKAEGCSRAIIVAHNAHFDHSFISAAVDRANYKRSPFHPFSSFDTATLSGIFFGQTVLANACRKAGVVYDQQQAHGAAYDAAVTAELFCFIVNRYGDLLRLWNENYPEQAMTTESEAEDQAGLPNSDNAASGQNDPKKAEEDPNTVNPQICAETQN